jgi:quercetin dioxygenase-like cupin family protein
VVDEQDGPVRFVRRRVEFAPGESRPSDGSEWRDALVTVERGEVDLECAGGRRRFTAGAVLWLAGIGLRVLHNAGAGPLVLTSVARGGPARPP